jgi:hypothetical protein
VIARLVGIGCVATAAAVIAFAATTDGSAATSVGAAASRVERAAAAQDLTACWTCHEAQWREWQASRHAVAWRDPIFQSEFAHGRPAWCVGCHAPLAPDRTAPSDDDPRVAAGVSCAACHERDGRMTSARTAATSPHATVVDPSFGSPELCATCHQFNFPVLGERGRLVRYTDEPMQATVAEWRASGIAADCVDCHGDSPGGHAFGGSHDAARVASALDITVCATRTTIEVALANRAAGHNVPSGGVHRRMVVRAWRSTAPERFAEHTLGRRFRPLSSGGKETIRDTTIPPGGARTARFTLASLGAATEPVNLELRYIYALDEHAKLGTDVSQQIWYRRVEPSELPTCR